MQNTIEIASAIITNANDELLTVRKTGSTFYMLPGGKINNGESLISTLLRELHEELGITLEEHHFEYMGQHSTDAVNEKNTVVQGNIFRINRPLVIDPQPHAEIEEVKWISKNNYKEYNLAHLLQEFALPIWLNQ